MTASGPSTPRALQRGLASLRSLASCAIADDTYFDAAAGMWVVPLWLELEQSGEFVGKRTQWRVLVDQSYPYGRLAFYPAAENGLTATFPHQDRNVLERDHRGWRTGKPCLDSPFRGERRATGVRDPLGDAEWRLRWHTERALEWLGAAASGRLLAPGDPFETPSRPIAKKKEDASVRIVHDESPDSFDAWSKLGASDGVAQIGPIPGVGGALAVGAFIGANGKRLRDWAGRQVDLSSEHMIPGLWWLWPSPIVVPPWHSPGTWGELRKAGKAAGVKVDDVLQRLAPQLRGREEATILLLGYPIPARIGAAPNEAHWDAVLLPRLSPASGKPPKGFRPNARGWWNRDRHGAFADQAELVHLQTENWSAERLQARGRLPAPLRDARIVVLGVGALGSVVAELLVRAGLSKIALVDSDVVAAGNVCRHVVTLADVGQGKVRSVARRLRQISPHVDVSEYGDGLPSAVDAMIDLLEPFDVIIDCTASDEALALLARGWWSIPRLFASFSVGFAARRLFSFGVAGHQFPADAFSADMEPWLLDDTASWSNFGELLEGAGCWSPLFPARYDDIVLAASGCLKELEAMVAERPGIPRLIVFEQAKTDTGFQSFARVAKPSFAMAPAP